MPTYSYVCTECGHAFETVQGITDATLTACPVCQGALRKVFFPVGVAFKGSGFYRTDSRPSPAKEGAESTKSDAASGDSAGSDAKPAKKDGDKSSSSSSSGGSSDKSPSDKRSSDKAGSTKPSTKQPAKSDSSTPSGNKS
ncbi:MAG: FmdB family zinc ribbon protein [Candidatus Nanopelagicales bacterium]